MPSFVPEADAIIAVVLKCIELYAIGNVTVIGARALPHCKQWGDGRATTSPTTVTFPIAFTTYYVGQATDATSSGAQCFPVGVGGGDSAAQMTLVSNSTTTGAVLWIAIGY